MNENPAPKDFSGYTQAELDKVALRLNQRPRKTLGFDTPASKLRASATSTHRDHPVSWVVCTVDGANHFNSAPYTSSVEIHQVSKLSSSVID
jgi:hypothetical protein